MYTCTHCRKVCKTLTSKSQHEPQCKDNSNRIHKVVSKITLLPTKCQFCDKIYEKSRALSNHERRCPNNSDRKLELITKDGMKRLIEAGENQAKWDDEKRAKFSKIMKKAVDSHPESYTTSNRGRTKQIEYNGIKFQGNWELEFYKWTETINLYTERPLTGFKYIWEGERTYFPDFYIPSLSLYVEVKGYETDRDKAKWDQFKNKLCILKKAELNKIKNGQFELQFLLDNLHKSQ